MFNYLYMYSFIWGSILILYQLGWSSLNTPLHPILFGFFVVTIIVSALLGYKYRFLFEKPERFRRLPKLPNAYLIVITVCTAIGLFQLGYIPILNLITGNLDYGQLLATGGSIFRTLSIVGSIFGSVYQFAVYLEKRSKRDLLHLVIFLIIISLYSSRSNWMICLFCFFGIFISKYAHNWNCKYTLLIVLLAILVFWLFGVYGNIRSGGSWKDSSYIYIYGRLNGCWPALLPRQFGWAYIYLTSPLANLNFNFVNYSQGTSIDVVNFIYDFLPMFLAKRLPLYSQAQAQLVVPYLTVSSVWTNYLVHLGYLGLVFGYILQIALMSFACRVSRDTPFQSLTLLFCTECIAFSFFVNSFVYPSMGYPLIISVLISIGYATRHGQHLSLKKQL